MLETGGIRPERRVENNLSRSLRSSEGICGNKFHMSIMFPGIPLSEKPMTAICFYREADTLSSTALLGVKVTKYYKARKKRPYHLGGNMRDFYYNNNIIKK